MAGTTLAIALSDRSPGHDAGMDGARGRRLLSQSCWPYSGAKNHGIIRRWTNV
jgi:hypothetical protein